MSFIEFLKWCYVNSIWPSFSSFKQYNDKISSNNLLLLSVEYMDRESHNIIGPAYNEPDMSWFVGDLTIPEDIIDQIREETYK